MSGTEDFEDDEISLFDLWETLKAGWRWVFGGVVIGVLGALTAIFVAPSQYEAVAIVQVAQVGQIAQVGQLGQVGQVSSLPVEPPSQAVERMKSSAFQMTVAQALGDQQWVSALQDGGNPTLLTVSSPKGALNLIDLKTKGDSPEAATKIATTAITELAKRHAEIAKPAVERLTIDAGIAREKLRRAESELEGLNKLMAGASVKDERFTQLSLMTNLRVQKEAEIFYQRQMLSALDGALSPPNTQPARALEDVFVSDKPVSPKKRLLLALGLVGGLLLGVLWVFVSSAWRQARESRQARDALVK
jgi:LPS O-antigen subunit length determinant protein (WzzB/FepE family)